MKVLIFSIFSLILCSLIGCSGNRVNLEWEKNIQAKTGKKYGTVSYNPFGNKKLTEKRRRKAINRAEKFCHPQNVKFLKKEATTPYKRYGKKPNESWNKEYIFMDYVCEN